MRFGWVELLIVLVIVVLIFGGSKLRSLGSDVGGAVKGFKKSMADGEADGQAQLREDPEASEETVDAAAREREKHDT